MISVEENSGVVDKKKIHTDIVTDFYGFVKKIATDSGAKLESGDGSSVEYNEDGSLLTNIISMNLFRASKDGSDEPTFPLLVEVNQINEQCAVIGLSSPPINFKDLSGEGLAHAYDVMKYIVEDINNTCEIPSKAKFGIGNDGVHITIIEHVELPLDIQYKELMKGSIINKKAEVMSMFLDNVISFFLFSVQRGQIKSAADIPIERTLYAKLRDGNIFESSSSVN